MVCTSIVKTALGSAAVMALMSTPLAAKEVAPINFGAQPTFADAVSLSEAYARERLVDPESARFEWPYNFIAGSLKSTFGKRRNGYWTCGWLNARNRMGGYSGRVFLFVMVKDGAVIDYDLDPGDGISTAGATCASAIKNNQLPIAPILGVPANLTPNRGEPFGIQLAFIPTGAVIVTVASGSLASRIGLKIGDQITSINGVPLAGVSPTEMTKRIRELQGDVRFGMMNAQDIVFTRGK
jgi:PDZ domain